MLVIKKDIFLKMFLCTTYLFDVQFRPRINNESPQYRGNVVGDGRGGKEWGGEISRRLWVVGYSTISDVCIR